MNATPVNAEVWGFTFDGRRLRLSMHDRVADARMVAGEYAQFYRRVDVMVNGRKHDSWAQKARRVDA